MIQTNKRNLFENFGTFLVDASGVTYTDEGLVNGAKDFFLWCHDTKRKVFMCTNNTSHSPKRIASRLKEFGIPMPEEHVISSGIGLSLNKSIHTLINNKKAYIYGYESSKYYAQQAGALLCSKPEEAEVILLLSSLVSGNEAVYENVYKALLTRPNIPVICANPDHYVVSHKKLYPVIGFYAKKLEEQLNRSFIWVGKPLNNFTQTVSLILKQHNVNLDKNICFLDDNIENILEMQLNLPCTGTLVYETGLAKFMDLKSIISKRNHTEPDYIIDCLNLN